jgi:hypothetical protein
MFGRIKLTWSDTSPIDNTSIEDEVLLKVSNETQAFLYPQKKIAQRGDELGFYKDITFNFLDSLFLFFNTRNLFEGFESDIQLSQLIFPKNENVSFSEILAYENTIKLTWTDNTGTGIALATDKLYIKVRNITSNDNTKLFSQGNIAERQDTAIVFNASIGTLGQTVEIKLGFVSENNAYSEEVTFTRVIASPPIDYWVQGDGLNWLQGDGNNWIYQND